MSELFSRFILSIVFLTAIFAIANSVYADCEAAPDPLATGDCTATTKENTPERIQCCDRLYPPGSTDAQGQSTDLARHLCVPRKKMNTQDANAFQQSFTKEGPKGSKLTDRVPIIFLPGVAGTRLNTETGSELWPAAPVADRVDLGLMPDGHTPANGNRISIGTILESGSEKNYYGGILDSLKAAGYRPDIDLHTFAYDWRCDNASQFRLLDKLINSALSKTSQSKVILLAHSMGGLISRGYVSNPVGAAKVDTFITMGTPYYGAAKVYYGIVNGYDFGNPVVRQELMKVLLQNYPAAYQLLPQVPFIKDTANGQLLSLPDSNTVHYKWFTKVTRGLTSDNYYLTEGNERFFNPALLEAANQFHSLTGTKNSPKALNGVKQYVIIGYNISTLGSYEMEDWKPAGIFPGSYLEIQKSRKVVFRPKSTQGDGTVPLWSAQTSTATATYYIRSTDEDSADHAMLPNNKVVQDIVLRILTGAPPDPKQYLIPPNPWRDPEPEQELESLTEFVLHSDAHLRISRANKILGYKSQEFIEESLSGTFLNLDGIEYASVADMDATYKVEVTGIRAGKFTLDLNVKKNGTKYTFSYPEVQVKEGTVASLSLTPNQVPPAPEMTVTTDGQTSRISPRVGSEKSSSSTTNISIPDERTDFIRELNTTFTGNTPILRYYALNNAFPDQCQADCAKDPACAAYTYVKPGGYKAGDPPVCYLFSGLGPKVASDCCISGARNSQAPLHAYKACDYSMTEAIHEKWTELGSGEGKLGCPVSGETECGPSVKNTNCRLIQFKKDDGGYLLQHTSGPLSGKVFDVSGCMFKLYYQLNGPKSWLGLPTSDGYVTPPGSRQDFENGYILWDSKTWTCTSYNAGTPPPPQTQADVATPPPPKVPAKVPGMWQLVSMEQHGNLNRVPARPGDGDMIIEGATFNENGGEFTARIAMADVICAQREQELLHVKWKFNSDIRLLAPGATVPVTVEVHPVSTGTRCPFFALGRTEFILVWGSGGADYFPESDRSKYWGTFSNAQGAPGRRFNFYQMNPEDRSAAGGSTAFELTSILPGPTDPQRGYFGFVLHTNGCCGPPPNPKRGAHGFWYVYEFTGK